MKQLLPWLVAVGFFMESLDTTILNTAVPAIADALAVAPLSMMAVLSSYTLSLASFIPISGWMADRFGTRRVFASAIGLFTFASFLCGISSNIHVLVACRILQGCGGAMMLPVGRLTMVRTFAKSELIRAMNFVAIRGLIGPMLGPVVGGFIVHYFHWRAIFSVNRPGALREILIAISSEPCNFAARPMHLQLIQRKYSALMVAMIAWVSCLSTVAEGSHAFVRDGVPRGADAVLVTPTTLGNGAGWDISTLRRQQSDAGETFLSGDLFELAENDEFSREKLNSPSFHSPVVVRLLNSDADPAPSFYSNDRPLGGFDDFLVSLRSTLLLI